MVDCVENVLVNGVQRPIGGEHFDGSWTYKYVTILSSVSIAAGGSKTYALGDYLPNALPGQWYLIQLSTTVTTPATSGASVSLKISVPGFSNVTVWANTRGNYTQVDSIMPYILAKPGDTITITNGSSSYAATATVYLRGYCRVSEASLSETSEVLVNGVQRPIGGKFHDSDIVTHYATYLVNGVSLATNGSVDCSLANILPDDGCDYMCYFDGWATSGSTSGNSVYLSLYNYTRQYNGTTTWGNNYIGAVVARTAATRVCGGTIAFPVYAFNKKITVHNGGNATATNVKVRIRGYRRLGNNDSLKNCLDNVQLNGVKHQIGGHHFSGPFTIYGSNIASYSSMAASASYTIDLSNIIPKDGYEYEGIFNGYSYTGTTSGNFTDIGVTSELYGMFLYRNTRTASSQGVRFCTYWPIAKDRKITIQNAGSVAASETKIALLAYRRLGRND